MKASYFKLGNSHLSYKTLIKNLGGEPMDPPPITKKTFKLGMSHSPEFLCLPFKIIIGSFIEALDKGADAIFTPGARGPQSCQFVHFRYMQEKLMKEMGYKFKMIELSGETMDEMLKAFQTINPKLKKGKMYAEVIKAVYKASAIKEIELEASRIRALEINKGETRRIENEEMKKIEKTLSFSQIRLSRGKAIKKINSIKIDKTRNPLKIGLAGDIYSISEPQFNLDIIRRVGEEGVHIEQSKFLSDIYRDLPMARPKESITYIANLAKKYLPYGFGAFNINAAAEAVNYARKKFDGIIQLYTLNCMPETTVKAILPRISKDLNIPIISIPIDEQTTENGFYTKVEAFLDMLKK